MWWVGDGTLITQIWKLAHVSPKRLGHVLREAAARCFGEPPEEDRVARTVDLIVTEHASIEGGRPAPH